MNTGQILIFLNRKLLMNMFLQTLYQFLCFTNVRMIEYGIFPFTLIYNWIWLDISKLETINLLIITWLTTKSYSPKYISVNFHGKEWCPIIEGLRIILKCRTNLVVFHFETFIAQNTICSHLYRIFYVLYIRISVCLNNQSLCFIKYNSRPTLICSSGWL